MSYFLIKRELFEDILSELTLLAERVKSIDERTTDLSKLKWLTGQNVCQLLNISKRTLLNYRNSGKIPYTQIEYKMFYKPQDIIRLINDSKIDDYE